MCKTDRVGTIHCFVSYLNSCLVRLCSIHVSVWLSLVPRPRAAGATMLHVALNIRLKVASSEIFWMDCLQWLDSDLACSVAIISAQESRPQYWSSIKPQIWVKSYLPPCAAQPTSPKLNFSIQQFGSRLKLAVDFIVKNNSFNFFFILVAVNSLDYRSPTWNTNELIAPLGYSVLLFMQVQ